MNVNKNVAPPDALTDFAKAKNVAAISNRALTRNSKTGLEIAATCMTLALGGLRGFLPCEPVIANDRRG
jgi:hypothetical protein